MANGCRGHDKLRHRWDESKVLTLGAWFSSWRCRRCRTTVRYTLTSSNLTWSFK